MHKALPFVVVGGLLAATAGCSRSAPESATVTLPAPPPAGPGVAAKGPRFESELINTYTVDGGTSSGKHTSTRYDNDKPFTAAENVASTFKGSTTTVKFELKFVEHRDGKDIYKLKYTVEKAEGSSTTTREASYDGKRTVLLEDPYGSIVMQPPTK